MARKQSSSGFDLRSFDGVDGADAMRIRSKSEAKVLRASVALMWVGGKPVAEIATACGITPLYTQVIACQLRKTGMDLPLRKPTVRRGPRGPNRRTTGKRLETARRGTRPDKRAPGRDDILDAWSNRMQARDIALLTRRSLGSVKELVRRARLAGDTRATRHTRWPAPSVVLAAA